MALTLYINQQEWTARLYQMEERFPNYLPVIKGNGYGFGNSFLADAAALVGKESIAVGTVEEARQIESTHSFKEIIVLTPVVKPLTAGDIRSDRVYTVGSLDQLKHLLDEIRKNGEDRLTVNILFKCASTMKRFGMTPAEMIQAKEILVQWNKEERIQVRIKGTAIHFPQERINSNAQIAQIGDWIAKLQEMELPCNTMYVSHLTSATFKKLCQEHPSTRFIMRVGTDLWLNDRKSFSVRSTVVDVKPLARGERYGYKQRRAWKNGYLVSVSGGTAHGIGLAAPSHVKGVKDWVKLTALWFLGLFNLHPSPFSYQGKRLWFAEPPHMQTSLLKISKGTSVPSIGDELTLQVRMTTSVFDQYVVTHPLEESTQEAAAAQQD